MLSQTLVNATDLVGWAGRNRAAEQLPLLIRRLVLATVSNPSLVAFRAEEGTQLGGCDGTVRTEEGNAFVPDRLSVWEMGKDANPKGKADDDYTKRTNDPGEVDPADAAFVFVTPRRWSGKDDWIAARNAEGRWREVRAYDADDLHTWLETAPSVHVWLSLLLGKRPDGAEDLERYWRNWSEVTQPPIVPAILLAGRDEIAENVRNWLDVCGSALGVRGDGRDEAVAILASVVETSGAKREALYARSVVAHDPNAFRHLVGAGEGLLLVPLFADPQLMVEAVRAGHSVFVPLGRDDTKVGQPLEAPRLRREPIERALIEGGMEREQAVGLATLARRSLTAFRRKLSTVPGFSRPPWAEPSTFRRILPALFAGEWRDSVAGDREAIERIAGQPYDEFTKELARWTNSSDPPIRRIGDTWLLASKEDLWGLVGSYLTASDIDAFAAVAEDILGRIDPAWDLEPDRRYMANVLGATPLNSPTLLEGIADTLAAIGSRSDTAPSGSASRVQRTVRSVLDQANADWRLWATLSSVLPLLAEAAPEAFLDALEAGMDVVVPLFAGQGNPMFSRSPHTGILWALETVAWSPDHLARVAAILAELARRDPGANSNHANRPLNSLRATFLCWYPQTAAPFEQRLRVLDALRNREPAIAWQLLRSLIPHTHEIGHNSATPKWREWAPEERGTIGASEVIDSIGQATTRFIEDAATDAARWSDVFRELPSLRPDNRATVRTKLASLDTAPWPSQEAARLRDELRELVTQHSDFPDTEWALPADEIDEITALADGIRIDDPVDRNLWLFGHHPALPGFRTIGDWETRDRELERLRTAALAEVFATGGPASLLSVAVRSEAPWIVGHLLGRNDLLDEPVSDAFLRDTLTSQRQELQEAGQAFVAGRFARDGWDWAAAKLADSSVSGTDPELRALFYVPLPAEKAVWDRLDSEDKETQRLYWSRWGAYLDRPDAYEYPVRRLLEFDFPLNALHVLQRTARADRLPVPVPLIVETLQRAIASPPEQLAAYVHLAHDVGELFAALARSGEVDDEVLAPLEWNYLPLLKRRYKPVILHRSLTADPTFFMDIVKWAYKPRHEERSQLMDEEMMRARLAHYLLDGWEGIPGTQEDGSLSYAELAEWMETARELAAACDRAEIVEQLIGQAFARSPIDADGAWPHSAVRRGFEEFGTDDMETGFVMRVFNDRGVTTRMPTDGGRQEHVLAARYEDGARTLGDRWVKVAKALRRIAEGYRTEAMREDVQAELQEDTWR